MAKTTIENKIAITMCPASYGDSFFVQFPNEQINILIDAGFISTYNLHLKPKLQELDKQGNALDLLVVTHIDADHISGVIQLLEENVSNEQANVISIKNIWHNSYRHIQTQQENHSSLQPPSRKNENAIKRLNALGYPLMTEEKQKSISAQQGSSLASLIKKGGYNWNIHFNEKAVAIENQSIIQLTDNIKLILLSPNLQKLSNLKKYWLSELRKLGHIGKDDADLFYDDAFEFSLSREKEGVKSQNKISSTNFDIDLLSKKVFEEDTSVTNGSSISFILEYDNRKVLFLGDSHPSIIEESLKKIYSEEVIWFDAIKVSHHGSKNNTSPSLLALIDSDCYFISTNSNKFEHPDFETLVRIINRPTNKLRNLVFNYQHHAYHAFNNHDLMIIYQYNVLIADEMEEYVF
ncbi:MBL fold metallo-hydrolase [Wohlfahrtiimonas chitiniclastica]|uniref:AVAST type 1 anti-phage system MBL fold metallo-hydrolase Avs1a n=1 Tax=Wohlfahrtiimonas chitiniclastica TaxID=400946 RepID=UPI001BCEEA04|nr:AVAST type 1 anti-phage system MBL fold metallo-hydrolase Avs1a [Wohlfahrtiimonas chitiniclastica]MBS7821457.1 MBL fold metallo-hydrolase [Wohlfahrtiimonas chitiniclastica]